MTAKKNLHEIVSERSKEEEEEKKINALPLSHLSQGEHLFFLTSNGTLGRWLKERKKKKKKKKKIGREALTGYNKTPLINRVIDFVSKNRKKRRGVEISQGLKGRKMKVFQGV